MCIWRWGELVTRAHVAMWRFGEVAIGVVMFEVVMSRCVW
jgi:hypothetical protein